MDPIRTLIVDDEPMARWNLRLRLEGVPDFRILGECANGQEALIAIAELAPEVIFLDIQMPGLDGFGVIERIAPESMPVVVFVTAYDRYALDAFRVHALDYLLKPFEDERFAETLEACRRRVAQLRQPEVGEERAYQLAEPADASTADPEPAGGAPDPWRDRLVVKSRGRFYFLKVSSLDWIEAYGNYVRLHADGRTHILRKTMGEMESRLDPRLFLRISRSSIVNLDKVRDFAPAAHGDLSVNLVCGAELKLTRSYRDRFGALFGE